MSGATERWRFFRAGGFDQVRLETAQELIRIGQLDQKLWVALACPVTGLEFDQDTLRLVDSDGDGFVRAPELIEAVNWAAQRLSDVTVLEGKLAGLPSAAIRSDDALGAQIAEAAQWVSDSGKGEGALLTVEAIGAAKLAQLEKELAAWQEAGQAHRLLGEGTQDAYAALEAVRAKIEDWMTRCNLAAFDARAAQALAGSEEVLGALSVQTLTTQAEGIAEMPLSAIRPDARLMLLEGLNPAWRARMAQFTSLVVTPILGSRSALSEADWRGLLARWAGYEAWLAEKPLASEKLQGLQALEKLARYVRDLMVLANNFVAFKSFYARQGKAIFQVGTLYLDGRACELCLPVADAAKHASMAGLSNMFLAYLDCVRGKDKRSIVAAFTAGDADQLMVGRNGVFYDRQGADWNATIVKLMVQPISLRQAFWSPYQRLGRLVSSQLQKLAASKAQASQAQLTSLSGLSGAAPSPAKPTSAFDVGKFAGIFAAIGLALGAIGTALAATLGGLLSLPWWKLPLVLAGLVLLISGPAVVMAWFKLRSRHLGPILDANGWAVNARARINIPFGTSLTQRATLPDNAERSLVDPYADKQHPWEVYGGLAVITLVLAWWFLR